MGYWDMISDGVKRMTPNLSSVMNAGGEMYRYTCATFTKIDQVIGPDGGETRAQITLFTTTFAKNTARYVVYEGFKHIPGVNVVRKLVSKTMNDIKHKNTNHPSSETEQQTQVDISEEDSPEGGLRDTKSQLKNKKLRVPSQPRARL